MTKDHLGTQSRERQEGGKVEIMDGSTKSAAANRQDWKHSVEALGDT